MIALQQINLLQLIYISSVLLHSDYYSIVILPEYGA